MRLRRNGDSLINKSAETAAVRDDTASKYFTEVSIVNSLTR